MNYPPHNSKSGMLLFYQSKLNSNLSMAAPLNVAMVLYFKRIIDFSNSLSVLTAFVRSILWSRNNQCHGDTAKKMKTRSPSESTSLGSTTANYHNGKKVRKWILWVLFFKCAVFAVWLAVLSLKNCHKCYTISSFLGKGFKVGCFSFKTTDRQLSQFFV